MKNEISRAKVGDKLVCFTVNTYTFGRPEEAPLDIAILTVEKRTAKRIYFTKEKQRIVKGRITRYLEFLNDRDLNKVVADCSDAFIIISDKEHLDNTVEIIQNRIYLKKSELQDKLTTMETLEGILNEYNKIKQEID